MTSGVDVVEGQEEREHMDRFANSEPGRTKPGHSAKQHQAQCDWIWTSFGLVFLVQVEGLGFRFDVLRGRKKFQLGVKVFHLTFQS